MTDVRASAAHDLRLLNAIELERRAGLVRRDDRARFTWGVILSRLAAAERLGIAPDAVTIDRRCTRCGQPHGKPQLPDTELHLSVSHSADLVVVALTSAGPVGIDVELIDESRVSAAAPLLFGPAETTTGSAVEFYTTWCRKESVVKATGDGMRVALAEVTVSGPREAPRLVHYPSPLPGARLVDLRLADGYAAALTLLFEHSHERAEARAVERAIEEVPIEITVRTGL